MTPSKEEMGQIFKEVKARQKRITDNGWKILTCDNYGPNHFLKLGADKLYKKAGRILCRNCVMEEL